MSSAITTVQLYAMAIGAALAGLTANAAVLMQQLGLQSGFKDVRAPVAAVRNPGASLDSFNIEFQLDPAVWSVAGASVVQAVASGGAVAPVIPAALVPAALRLAEGIALALSESA